MPHNVVTWTFLIEASSAVGLSGVVNIRQNIKINCLTEKKCQLRTEHTLTAWITQRWRNDWEIPTGREGSVGGLCPSQVQGHVVAHLAAATDGAGAGAPHQLPQPEQEHLVQLERQSGRGGTGQKQSRGGHRRIGTLQNMSDYVILFVTCSIHYQRYGSCNLSISRL